MSFAKKRQEFRSDKRQVAGENQRRIVFATSFQRGMNASERAFVIVQVVQQPGIPLGGEFSVMVGVWIGGVDDDGKAGGD